MRVSRLDFRRGGVATGSRWVLMMRGSSPRAKLLRAVVPGWAAVLYELAMVIPTYCRLHGSTIEHRPTSKQESVSSLKSGLNDAGELVRLNWTNESPGGINFSLSAASWVVCSPPTGARPGPAQASEPCDSCGNVLCGNILCENVVVCGNDWWMVMMVVLERK